MRIVYVLIIILVAIFAVIFALQNSVQIAISFFSWSASGSLSLVLILTLTIGMLLGVLIMAPSVFRRSVQFSGLRRKMSRLEKEKTSLNKKIAASEEKGSCPPDAPKAGNEPDTPELSGGQAPTNKR